MSLEEEWTLKTQEIENGGQDTRRIAVEEVISRLSDVRVKGDSPELITDGCLIDHSTSSQQGSSEDGRLEDGDDDDDDEEDDLNGEDFVADNYCNTGGELELDPEELQNAWYSHWDEKGDEIVNTSWVQKYKEYINPEFDLSSWVGSEAAEALKTEQASSDAVKTDQAKYLDTCKLSESDVETMWLSEWENHHQEVYQQEYKKFLAERAQIPARREMPPPEILRNPSLTKYWKKRYHLFSKYDGGIKLDEESWFSVTPEEIAVHIAKRCRRVDGIIVDAFCGCGGNSIQFAKKFHRVISIDIDPIKIEYAKHNAKIYGVEDKIDFIVADYMTVASSLRADVVFLSPPWGGPEYLSSKIFDLKKMKPLDGYSIFEVTKEITSNVAYYVPRTTNKIQLMQLAGDGGFVEIEQNNFKGRPTAITAYYGELINPKFLKKVKSSTST